MLQIIDLSVAMNRFMESYVSAGDERGNFVGHLICCCAIACCRDSDGREIERNLHACDACTCSASLMSTDAAAADDFKTCVIILLYTEETIHI